MRAKKKLTKRMLALLLSAVMIMQPAGSSMIAHATEADADQTALEEAQTPEVPEIADEQEETGDTSSTLDEGKEGNSDQQETEGSESTSDGQENAGDNAGDQENKDESGDQQDNGTDNSDQQGTGNENPDEQNPDEENPDEQDPDEQEPEEEDEEVADPEEEEASDEELEEDEQDAEEEKEDEDLFSSMPSSYKLSSEQKEMKSALSASMGDFDDSAEGELYVERQVFAFADTRQEAEAIAEAYNAELISFDYGVAVLKLAEGVSVGKALSAAASLDNTLPAVFPDYYRYMHVDEGSQDGSLLDFTEEEYELDGNIADVTASEEPTLEAYEQAVEAFGDPNMSYDSEYYQWQHVNVGSVYAWDAGYKGQGVKVAVLDSGVSGNSDVVPIKSINASNEETADDGAGHGTHVAGIIGAQLNGTGGAGIAPEVSIVNIKVLDNNGIGRDSNILRGMKAAIAEKVDIMNMSLGGIGYNPAVQKVVNDAYEAGIALFVSAGNDGGSNMCYPAAYDHVICIAATDNNNQRAYFSNYGAWVDLSAPGVNIWSTSNEGQFENMSGTSQACPVAVGEAAVILSSGHTDLAGKSGKDKVDALENLMKKNTVSAGSGMGKGVTSLTKVFKLSTAATKPAAPVITPTVSADVQSVSFNIEAQAGMTVYYTDNGKAPSFKNGQAGDGTKQLQGNKSDLVYSGQQKITLSAIAVNESGVCSAVKKVTAQLSPWVTKIEISGVSKIGKTKSTQLTAEVLPGYAKDKKIIWSIDGNPQKISVNAKGKVTANGANPGDYTIRATANDRKGTPDEVSTSFVVTVLESDYIKSVKFSKTKDTISVGKQPVQYDVATEGGFTPEKKPDYTDTVGVDDFVWSSSNKALAAVDSKGVVTAKGAGVVKITATANDGSNKKATFTLTIKQLATSVQIVGDDQVAAGASITLKAVVGPDKVSNKKVEWTSSDDTNVPVKNGVVKPKAGVAGTYTITAKALDGSEVFDTKQITVKKGKITAITFDKKTASIFRTAGKSKAETSVTIEAAIAGNDCAYTAYTCTSSNPGVAKATAKGDNGTVTINVKATGKASGKTTITLMATDGSKKKATCNVTVTNPVSKVNIAPSSGSNSYVAKGKSLQLKATLESEYGVAKNKKVKWELWTTKNYPTEGAEPKLVDAQAAQTLGVKVSANGKITATKNAIPGILSVKAIAMDGSGAEAKYSIRVTDPVKRVYLIGRYTINGTTVTDELDPKAINVLPQVIQTEDQDVNDKYQLAGSYPFILGFEGKSLWGGVTVSSTNPKVASATFTVNYLEDGTPVPMVYVSADNPGNTVITVKAMDGSGAQVKYKFMVERP